MGQPIAVSRKPSDRAGVVRFEINRTLTGMGHERYGSIDDVVGDRPPDVLARRLFEAGVASSIHIYSNVINVELASGASDAGIEDIIRGLYIHYKEGVQPSFQG
ncbi:MAG TPA: hypothetical protein VM345_03535 [Acidimicrobiales bacterium]|jgi:hypothetical protein|nr:hypothetical protein [Acidimicrobiales bacterium]